MGYIIWIILIVFVVGSVLTKAGATRKDIPEIFKWLGIHFIKVALLLTAIYLLGKLTGTL
ncbi:MAG: hypothetical protein A3J46_00220 [Candidatus Yanofskybacteria bacterium RIFCSPHIGHO2_02_FULL_41_11]|uniref:Uncharacterized protein n=1 Tax=Candidatus Yanofskybacteria bacterium RIFCSPHIGHO2_02_FULL_41_11 TaxID=1802675 RepID=A0A1F8F7A3_9BACT|nr:MAG: hypothetical protein UW86_C0007G0010 [Microgenomates group bacterium GW2011_GWA1_Microgenomates_45_10]OGN09031.1 MAG: hypothetical protein A3J46_00220 [Candidatus Yanofskybacteria bacterium RIFCSPHIGHO2_02_FULL_41_11]